MSTFMFCIGVSSMPCIRFVVPSHGVVQVPHPYGRYAFSPPLMSYDCRLQIDFLSLLVSENSYPSYVLGMECSGKVRGIRSPSCHPCPLAIFLPVLQPVVLFQSVFLLYVHLKVRAFVQVIHLSNRLQRVTAAFPSLFCFAQPKTNPPNQHENNGS